MTEPWVEESRRDRPEIAEGSGEDVDRAPPARSLAQAGAAPEVVRDLAIAFRTSAEAIEGVRDLQAELVKALKRQDRSELVLQSTQALNETFRNLTTVQRALLERLDEPRRSGGGRLVPLMLIGLLVAFLAGTWLVASVLEQLRVERGGQARLVVDAADRAVASYREGVDAHEAESTRAIDVLEEQVHQLREHEQALQKQLGDQGGESADLLKQLKTLEGERDDLARQIRAARDQVVAKQAMESDLVEANGKIAVLEPRLTSLQQELDQQKSETSRLRKRLAAFDAGLPDPEGETKKPEAAPKTASDAPAPLPEKPIDRDPNLLAKIRDRINEMLDQGSRPRESLWQVTRMDGVTTDGLVDVIAMRYERATGRLLAQVTAREAGFEVRRGDRAVDLTFKRGTVHDAAGTRDLPAAGLVERVADGEMYRLWSQSGLLFVRTLP